MYSGTTFHHKSGNLLGVHQKINKAAYQLVSDQIKPFFPSIKAIQHFEGKNGPDGIKRKNPGTDEPWHFIDPHDPSDNELLVQITHHIDNLTKAVKQKDEQRSAFEAAWLSHAVVDGLTPAHHFPLEDHLEEVRGEPRETRDSVRKKLVIPGDNKRQKLKNNWEFWGAKGVMTSHLLFELGVASAITPLRMKQQLTSEDLKWLEKDGFEKVFKTSLQEVASLKMYETFTHWGWTPTLARQTKHELIPIIVKAVAFAWIESTRKN